MRSLVETGCWRASAAPIGSRRPRRPSRCRRRCRRSWRRASTGCRRRTSACSRRPRSSARTSRSRCSQAIAGDPDGRAAPTGSPASRRPSSSTRRASSPTLEYTFKHALTHEVAYGSLLQDRRRALHARIVEAIEALYPERLAEHVERLAHHALRGEVWEKAVAYLRQAGAKAMRALGLPGGGRLLRAGARGAPASPGEPRAHGAGHRPPPRLRSVAPAARASSSGSSSISARPRPSPRRWATSAGWRGPSAYSDARLAGLAATRTAALELGQRALGHRHRPR